MKYFVLTFILVLVGLGGLSVYRSFTTDTVAQPKLGTGGMQDVAGITVDMLNTRDDGVKMIYSEDVLRVDVGDTVTWLPKTKGHNVQFIKAPDGIKKLSKSKLNKKYTYKFEKSGMYLYQCTPHKGMGMIALVVVDNDTSNVADVATTKVFGGSKKKLKKSDLSKKDSILANLYGLK